MRRRHFLNIASGGIVLSHWLAQRLIAAEVKTSGKALGVPDCCMSGTLVTMILDGLARKHRLKLRDMKSTDKEQ